MKRLRRTVSFADASVRTLFFNEGFSGFEEVAERSFLILNANGCGASADEREDVFRRAGLSPDLGENEGRDERDASRDEGRLDGGRPTGDGPSSDKVSFFLGPLLDGLRTSDPLPRDPADDERPPLLGALRPSELRPRNPAPETLPPLMRPVLAAGGDNAIFFFGPLFEVLVGLLFLGDGDDFVKGN